MTLSTPSWSQTLELVPGVTQRVVVPTTEGAEFMPVTIATSGGFVPAEVERAETVACLARGSRFVADDASRTFRSPAKIEF